MQSPIPAMHPRFLLQPHASTHAPHSVPYAFSTPYIPSAPAYSQGGGQGLLLQLHIQLLHREE
nr:hypothetical protein Q903MT_gene1638 [Picea sitchensis]